MFKCLKTFAIRNDCVQSGWSGPGSGPGWEHCVVFFVVSVPPHTVPAYAVSRDIALNQFF